MHSQREADIIKFVKSNPRSSSKEIFDRLNLSISYATLKRILTKLKTENALEIEGKGKGTKYIISASYELLESIDIDQYYEREIDERVIKEQFNLSLIT
ncbi:MAG: BlaI/MecI/CopY family transcriptional regulator, partial [Bacteroidota bacterium]